MKKGPGQGWALEDLSGVLFVGVNRWGEPGSREIGGDGSHSPGESGDKLAAGWSWADGMVGPRGSVLGVGAGA